MSFKILISIFFLMQPKRTFFAKRAKQCCQIACEFDMCSFAHILAS